uniref:Uncharacterized protein n=1 Tax=Pyramimonas orientalis virus TaxID=455367 RepID=A0A7M3UNW4_POV01|nr:hypothetical protein HWQ62_00268 [Pyramimonas orientalis virus]
MYILNQILSTFVTLNKCTTYLSNKLYDLFDTTIIYSVVHDISDPFTKTYSCMFVPFVYVSFNTLTYTFEFSLSIEDKADPAIFFEDCVVLERKITHMISSKPIIKITNDFQKLSFISVSVNDNVFKKLYTLITDFPLSANHICTIMQEDIGSTVQCTDKNLDEFTFKDIDLIK